MAFDPQGSVLLEELTWKEIGEALEHGWTRAVVVSGSTEQHGPHLPLITDTALGYALGERVARKWGKAFLAPVIRPACSDHHMGFPGSFTVPEEVYGQMLRAVCDSLVHHGFKALYLISSHGGNFAPIDRLAPSLAAAYADQGVRVMTGVNLDDFIQSQHQTLTALGVDTERGGSHAGLAETSQMLAVRPDLVREHAYEPGHVGPYNREQMFKGGIKGVSANGILGDPTGGSTAEIGEALLDALSDRLTAVVQERQ